MDWLDLLAVQGTLRRLHQHHSSKASILLCSAFFIVQLSHPYLTPGKTIALTRWTFVDKVMSLLFNMLSKVKSLSCVQLLVTTWTAAYQAAPSMGFSRQEHWSGVPLPSLMLYAAAAAKSLQLCPTLCDPIDGSPPGSPIPGILQARTLEWVTISFSNA